MGLVPGYDHGNRGTEDRYSLLLESWERAMGVEFSTTGQLVSAIFQRSRLMYPKSRGCPPGGEEVVVITGSSNPVMTSDLDAFTTAVVRVVSQVQALMGQRTVRLEFQPIRSLFMEISDD